VLRQDPDIIMVGEIRDKETAHLAVQAALTGHLVLSTLHTNNAVGALPRLIDMGVDPFLLAPTIRLVIAQRLVRRICPDTGIPIPIEGELKKRFDTVFANIPERYRSRIPETNTMLGIQPTSTCPVGTRGRIGVYEILSVNEKIRNAILDPNTARDLTALAVENGMFTMEQDAFIKAMHHMIPYEEIAQVSVTLSVDESEVQEEVDTSDQSVNGSNAIESYPHDLV
jgi:type IV pilus assembly protein PilB